MSIIDATHNLLINLFDKNRPYRRESYSQEGEDVVMANIFLNKKDGFYVDVGAHHPFRYSNTYFFYNLGWRGINIDATPGSMALFKETRPRDINLETAIANSEKKVTYCLFDEPALNSFHGSLAKERNQVTPYKINKTITLKPKKLSQILDQYLPSGTKINFMSIDVEGYEHEVIISNNWAKYRPEYLLLEILKTKLADITKNKTYLFLKKKGYTMIAITGRTVIFKKT